MPPRATRLRDACSASSALVNDQKASRSEQVANFSVVSAQRSWVTSLVLLVSAASLAGWAYARERAAAPTTHAAQEASRYKLTPVGRFDAPVQVTAPPGDVHRLFVVEKTGRIRLLVDGRPQPRPFLDLTAVVEASGNEQGLLSMAFAPDYVRSGLFYVYYTGKDEYANLVEYKRATANRAAPRSARRLLHNGPPAGEHYAGNVQFGPGGKLYLSIGDGGLNQFADPMRAQRLNDIHGKIIAVNRKSSGTKVVVRGLRNPWRFWFDRPTGDLYVGDPGEYVVESIDYAPGAKVQGTNFGWPCFEGTLVKPEFPAALCPKAVPPLYEWVRQYGNCAAIGGLVVRDPHLKALNGHYLFADFCLGEILHLNVHARSGARGPAPLGLRRPMITSFGVDTRQHVYVSTLNGLVYRLDPR
jgi:glucose/arabinose dehydrogenase